jgi:hypothetical protein
MTQTPVLRVEVGKGRLCGLLSLGDLTSTYCFSTPKQQKTGDITPDQNQEERGGLYDWEFPLVFCDLQSGKQPETLEEKPREGAVHS